MITLLNKITYIAREILNTYTKEVYANFENYQIVVFHCIIKFSKHHS